MNEEQYRKVCEACDRVLLAPDSTLERIAIPWLHVIREHPVFLEKYTDFFVSDKSASNILRKWLRFLRYRAGWLRQFCMAIRSKGESWYGSKELPQEVDVVFVSHLVELPCADNNDDDYYFGNLPKELTAKNYSVLVAQLNHTDQRAEYFSEYWADSDIPRVVLGGTFGVKREWTLYRRLKKESCQLKNLAIKSIEGLFRDVVSRASQEAISGGSRTNLRVADQISILVARLKPKVIIVTYEGHAWERVVFAAARSVYPKVRCFGYQHSALFRLQHAIRRKLDSKYNPDQILTAGTVSKGQLEITPDLKGITISVLGSNRALNDEITNEKSRLNKSKESHLANNTCLVLPEGIMDECMILFKFSRDCARANPYIQFIWRLHPVINFEMLVKKNPGLKNLPENIILSNATMEEDIVRSRWALYRGSTAIIRAIMAGLEPIYLMCSPELTIDPLYELKNYLVSVETIDDFLNVVAGDQDKSQKSENLERNKHIGAYCNRIFTPLNSNALDIAITSAGKI